MADNPGAFPLDPMTEVGQFRALIGDSQSTPFDPPTPGVQNYAMYSDLEIEAFLFVSNNSVEGALSGAYMQMAAAAASESKLTKDFDLSIDLTKRSGDFLRLAQAWQGKADALSADIFEIFDVNIDSGGVCVPELAPRPWRYRGC